MLVLSIGVMGFRFVEKDVEFIETEEEYIVREGDTLYDISEDYVDNSVDIREYVFELKKYNKIESMIYPGQKIKLLEVK
jgi:LysM repeat protein